MKKLVNAVICTALILCTQSILAQDYFQQEVNYKIEVELDDNKHFLSGNIEIEYINNSPDQLDFIWFHLWPNAYSGPKTALGKQLQNTPQSGFEYLLYENYQGFIKDLNFNSSDGKLNMEFPEGHNDYCKVILNTPLLPGESRVITTPFTVKIPLGKISRLGHIDQSYQITQWYPKPAVYDKDGWHQMPYLNMGEFYSEYGSFDVSITLPENYVVGATGDLQNQEEIEWLNNKAEECSKLKEFPKIDEFPESSDKNKTLRFIQHNVHDFAWFADKRYYVLKGEVTTPHTKRKVDTWVMFTDKQSDLWKDAIEYVNDAVYYYSLWFMDYPYNHCTAVYGGLSAGGGMEYPNITVIGNSGNKTSLEMVIMHEVGHNWFYGLLGSDERDHGWIDEGLNSFAEARYMVTKYGKEARVSDFMGTNKFLSKRMELDGEIYPFYQELLAIAVSRLGNDQPSETTSNEFGMANYGICLYQKPARYFEHLQRYLGEKEFDKIMKSFFREWAYKHPQPEDLKAHFEKESGKNLDWLFEDFIKTKKYNDYKIKRLKNNRLLVKNSGHIEAPVSITGIKNNKEIHTQWVDGFSKKKWIDLDSQLSGADSLILGYEYKNLDMYPKNNMIRTQGIFPKSSPLRIQFAGFAETKKSYSINYLPAVGYNNANGFMTGLYIYSDLIPKPRFEFRVNPMFGFRTQDLNGNADFAYNIVPKSSKINLIQIYTGIRSYSSAFKDTTDIFRFYNLPDNNTEFVKDSHYTLMRQLRSKIGVNIRFAPKNYNLPRENILDLAYYDNRYFSGDDNYQQSFFRGEFKSLKKKGKFPVDLKIKAIIGKGLTDVGLTASTFTKYNSLKRSGIESELHMGYRNMDGNSDFRMNNLGVYPDMEYDEILFERMHDGSSALNSAQFINKDGAFVSSFYDITANYKVTLKLSAGIPGLNSNFIHVFGHAAYFDANRDQAWIQNRNPLLSSIHISPLNDDNFIWEAGLRFNIAKDWFSLYWPIFVSDSIKKQQDFFDLKGPRVRFSINFDKLSLFKYLDGRTLTF
jgi:hypothetical protein